MKLSAIYQALAIACISTTGLATLFLEDLPSNLTIGSTVRLKWTADHDYVSDDAETMRHQWEDKQC
jgi:hypothetical protein